MGHAEDELVRAVVLTAGTVLSRERGDGLEPLWVDVPIAKLTYLAYDDGRYTLGGTTDLDYAPPGVAAEFVDMRQLAQLPDVERRAVAAALALDNWNSTHQYCPRCGNTSEQDPLGRSRTCATCAHTEFARTDPEVLVLAEFHEAALLIHSPQWPVDMYSAVSGYIDPGETAEEAAVRELAEETGLHVTSLRYVRNEPWPYPHCLMVCFVATTDSTFWTGSAEVEHARWTTRSELRDALTSGIFRLAAANSPGRLLIQDWTSAEGESSTAHSLESSPIVG